MKHFKKIGLALITFGFFYSAVSCSKDKNQDNVDGYGIALNTAIQIRIEDNAGNDLLNKELGSSLKEGDIERIFYVGQNNKEEVYYNPKMQSPKGFEISRDEKSYYISFGLFTSNTKDKVISNFLRIGKQGKVYEIKAEIEQATPATKETYGGGVVSLTKVWLDGNLAWEAGSENPVERKAEVKIVF